MLCNHILPHDSAPTTYLTTT